MGKFNLRITSPQPLIVGKLTIPQTQDQRGWIFPDGKVIQDALKAKAAARRLHYEIYKKEAR